MTVKLFLCIAVLVSVEVDATIPLPCATAESLTARTCCPVPNPTVFPDAGPCGGNLGRGSCEAIAIPNSEFDPNQTDVRMKWPIQYFNSTCVCEERFGGVDCGECSYAYNDGSTDCTVKTVLPRPSVADMTDEDWTYYREILIRVKFVPSRYAVATANFTPNIQEVIGSLVRPSIYDLYIWMHYEAAKDNTLTINSDHLVDFAHNGPGFLTWHRQFSLWLEREIQIEFDDHLFRLPYWDWRAPSQREILFRTDRLGVNVDGVVDGDLFLLSTWITICWINNAGLKPILPICNPNVPSGQILRRCANATLCEKNDDKWPSYEDIDRAVSINEYDTSPYNSFVVNTKESFRNFLEGFISRPGSVCQGNTMCSFDAYWNMSLTRTIHNVVHVILGIGDLKTGLSIPFDEAGVMACLAASPNDPIFINHHIMLDCVFEAWLQRNKDCLSYPRSSEIREGHKADNYMVPFIPLYMQKDMLKTADNFGYSCFLPNIDADTSPCDEAVPVQAYANLVISLLIASALASI